jgi:energy-coupling factor transporter ATP-binding protein EcfA2
MRTDNTNPYVGLRPFDVDESILFFGRNDQTLELLQRLHQHHFVAVVGSSGSGKSSLLRAGLIPALKAGYLVDDSDHWFIAIMKPGQSPLYNLAEAILLRLNPATDAVAIAAIVQKIKEEGADALLNFLVPLRKEQNVNFFLLVDQFEELFRFAMDQKDVAKRDEAIDFVNIMLELSQQKNIPFYTVITMRSDFIGDCAQFYHLPEAMNQSQYLVPRLNRMELKTVIEGPARLYGGKLNPALTSRLLNELGKVKDELPLLQHALMRIWDFEMNVNKSGELDLEDYDSIGGIEKALSNHADEALTGLSKEELRITKELFQSLTAIDENGRKIRRPVLLSQLKELTAASKEQLLTIINLFISDKRSFLVINNAGGTGDKVIDISHESLIRQWNTLSKWVDEEGESAANYVQLAEAARLHRQNKKDLLSGSELELALDWYNKFKPAAAWADRYQEGFEETKQYLMASEKEREEKQKWEADRIKQEKAGKQRQRYLVFGVGILLLLAIVAFILTFNSTKKSNQITFQNKKIKTELIRADSLAQVAAAQKAKAEEYAKEANFQKEKAVGAQQMADAEKHKAQEAGQLAIQQRNLADHSAYQAKLQELFALRDKELLQSQQTDLAKKLKLISATNDSITSAINRLANEKDPAIIYDQLKQISQYLYSKNTDSFETLKGDTRYAKTNDFLQPGQAIISKNLKYLLVYQKDGNLVIFKKKGMVPRWESSTTGSTRAMMRSDGNFVIYLKEPVENNRDETNILWSTRTGGHPKAYIVMQEDGNLVIYDDDGDHKHPIWASQSFDPNWEFDDDP